jgi:hypothetical protein
VERLLRNLERAGNFLTQRDSAASHRTERLVATSCCKRVARAGAALSTWPSRRSRFGGGWH